MLSPLFQRLLTRALQVLLTPVTAYLTEYGILDVGESAQFYVEVSAIIVTLGWTAYDVVKRMRLGNTRAALPKDTTLAQAEAVVADGKFAPASTPKNAASVIVDAKTGDPVANPAKLVTNTGDGK